jgi:uracil-DNA glycosylase
MGQKVICIGSNPATASKTTLPFAGDTRSDVVLAGWINSVDGHDDYYYANVLDKKTDNNAPLTMRQIDGALRDLSSKIAGKDKIVALGKTAAKALNKLGVEFYEMPHPSGLNRKLNDKVFMEQKLKGLREYISKPKAI